VDLDGAGVLIRGASGAGKSRLAHMLLLRAPLCGRAARLVADDRVVLTVENNGLIASSPAGLAGLIELRGLGIARVPHLARTRLQLVIDLVEEELVPRLPTSEQRKTAINGVLMARAFAHGPERALDTLLTLVGHSDFELDGYEPLAPRHQDGNTALS
jgi:HPr kinase/phosphorylase